MNMCWSEKWFVSSEWGSDAFVHMLRAAAIAAVVSSCSTMKAQSEADITKASAEEPPDPPLVEQLPTSLSDEIKRQAVEVFRIEPSRLQNAYAIISYTDEDDYEKLLAFVPTVRGPEREIHVDSFRVPTGPGPGDYSIDFREAMVVFTESPDAQTSCGASSTGGTRYCRP
jgi:hypothetical protein